MGKIILNTNSAAPKESIYEINIESNDGSTISFEKCKGKMLLIVNTASDCGYTPQYAQLQELCNEFKNELVVIAVPSNDFGQQEPLDDNGVKQFCEVRYGVTFPLTKKQSVVGANKTKLYKWLTDKNKNGWNNQEPEWNFYKYLITETEFLKAFFLNTLSHALMKL